MRSKPIEVSLLIAVAVVVAAFWTYGPDSSRQAPADRDMPGENFDPTAMAAIDAAMTQYDVAGSPHDHAVYEITGGLGFTNPRLLSWDGDGNMEFGGNGMDTRFFTFRETAASPANWSFRRDAKGGVAWANGPAQGCKPVPWEKKFTQSGVPYYRWNMIPNEEVQFYFRKGNTYIVLREEYDGTRQNSAFPEGLVSHLMPLNNPVSKEAVR